MSLQGYMYMFTYTVLLTQTGQTLLHYACSLGKIDIVIYLINRHDCSIREQEHVSVTPDLVIIVVKLCVHSAAVVWIHSTAHGLSL